MKNLYPCHRISILYIDHKTVHPKYIHKSKKYRKYLQVAGNEASKARLAKVGVDTGGTSSGTALTPRNNTELHTRGSVNNGATAVTLARVLATLGQSSAEHGGGDASRAVVGVAGGTGDDGDIDLEEVDGQGLTTGAGGAPASDGGTGASSRVGSGSSQLSIRDGRAGWDRRCELQDGDIVVVGSGRVGRVDLDR